MLKLALNLGVSVEISPKLAATLSKRKKGEKKTKETPAVMKKRIMAGKLTPEEKAHYGSTVKELNAQLVKIGLSTVVTAEAFAKAMMAGITPQKGIKKVLAFEVSVAVPGEAMIANLDAKKLGKAESLPAILQLLDKTTFKLSTTAKDGFIKELCEEASVMAKPALTMVMMAAALAKEAPPVPTAKPTAKAIPTPAAAKEPAKADAA